MSLKTIQTSGLSSMNTCVQTWKKSVNITPLSSLLSNYGNYGYVEPKKKGIRNDITLKTNQYEDSERQSDKLGMLTSCSCMAGDQ